MAVGTDAALSPKDRVGPERLHLSPRSEAAQSQRLPVSQRPTHSNPRFRVTSEEFEMFWV